MSHLVQHVIILMLCYNKNTIPLHMQGVSLKELIKSSFINIITILLFYLRSLELQWFLPLNIKISSSPFCYSVQWRNTSH